MKKFIITASLILLLAAGCNQSQPVPPPVPQTNHPATTTPPNNTAPKEGVVTPNAQGYGYVNDYFGFKLQFPGSYEGLRARVETQDTGDYYFIRFEVPLSKCSGGNDCYMNPVTVGVYTLAKWKTISKESPFDQYEVKINSSYAINAEGWQDIGEDTPAAIQIGNSIGAVIRSLVVY